MQAVVRGKTTERPAPLRLPGRLLEPGSNLRPRGMVAVRHASGGYRNRLIVREASESISFIPRPLRAGFYGRGWTDGVIKPFQPRL